MFIPKDRTRIYKLKNSMKAKLKVLETLKKEKKTFKYMLQFSIVT